MILIIRVRMDAEYLMGPALRHAVLQDKVYSFFWERESQDYLNEIAISMYAMGNHLSFLIYVGLITQ